MLRLQHCKLIVLSGIFLIAQLIASAPVACQAQDADPTLEKLDLGSDDGLPELPQDAVWQFGKFGDKANSNGYYRLAYSPDGRLLAARDSNLVVTVYNTRTRQKLCSVECKERVSCLNFSSDSRFFLTCAKGPNEKAKVWNARTGKLEAEFGADIIQAVFSKSGDRIFALAPRQMETYSWPECKLIESDAWNEESGRRQIISDDGKMVVLSKSIGRRENISLYNFETKSQVFLNGPGETPKSIVISPNGLWLAVSGYRNPKIQLWDLRGDPDDRTFFLPRHKRTVQSLAFTPDNRFLISTSWDQKSVVWDLLTKLPVGDFEGHKDNINSSACSPLDFTVATGSSGLKDCRVIVWDLKKKIFPPQDEQTRIADFEQAWKVMGSNFPKKSLIATRIVFESESKWLDKLGNKLGTQLQTQSQEKIDQWIKDLDDPSFQVREEAFNELAKSLGQARARLLAAQRTVISAEVQSRIAWLLKMQIRRPSIEYDELRRIHRSILALEMIGNEKAEKILEAIATGHIDIDIAQDAQESFKRVRARRNRK